MSPDWRFSNAPAGSFQSRHGLFRILVLGIEPQGRLVLLFRFSGLSGSFDYRPQRIVGVSQLRVRRIPGWMREPGPQLAFGAVELLIRGDGGDPESVGQQLVLRPTAPDGVVDGE